MTATKIPELAAIDKPKKKVLTDENRCVTDKYALVCFIMFLLTWICLWIYAIYKSDVFTSAYQYIKWHITNTSPENSTSINSRFDAIRNLSLSINSTLNMLNTDHLFSDFYFWHVVTFLRQSAVIYFMAQYFFSITEIYFKRDHSETINYFVIINTGKLIFTLIFCISFFSIYHNFYGWPNQQILILILPDVYAYTGIPTIVFLQIIGLITSKNEIGYKSVFRFFINCRSLLILRLLSLIMMILLVASNIVIYKTFCMGSRFSTFIPVLINLGSIHMIFFINNYVKMVIMAVSAYHNWDGHGKVISSRQILTAMLIIGRYHTGTIFMNTLFIRRFYTLLDWDKLPKVDVVMRHFGNHTDIVSHTLERSPILTIMHSLNFEEASISMIWFEVKGQLILNTKSLSAAVWKNISYCSITVALGFSLISIPNAESLWSRFVTISIFFTIQGIYNYIITTMDIVEFTAQFCKMKNERNDEISVEKQSEPTKPKIMI